MLLGRIDRLQRSRFTKYIAVTYSVRSQCRCRQAGGYRERQEKSSEVLPKVIVRLLRTKGCAAPVRGGTEAKPTSVQQQPDPTASP